MQPTMPFLLFVLLLLLSSGVTFARTRRQRPPRAPMRPLAAPTTPHAGAHATPPSPPAQRFSTLAPPYTAGAYTGPFTLLSSTALSGVADPDDQFGPEDKLVACNSKLVFVDLETDGTTADDTVISYDTVTQQWSRAPVVSNGCPDYPDSPSLIPRDGGYTVGSTLGPAGDRLIILGGNNLDNNVYFSDDCGSTWDCYDGPNFWLPRSFAPILHPTGIFPGNPMIMAGGLAGETTFSLMMGLSYDYGIHWQRPECASNVNCRGALTIVDSTGTCADADYMKHCYLLPDVPALPGALAYDWDTLWLFLEKEDVGGSGQLWYLNATNFRGSAAAGGGWSEFPNDVR